MRMGGVLPPHQRELSIRLTFRYSGSAVQADSAVLFTTDISMLQFSYVVKALFCYDMLLNNKHLISSEQQLKHLRPRSDVRPSLAPWTFC